MITKKDYLTAKKNTQFNQTIIDTYEKEQQEIYEKKQYERELACENSIEGHHFTPTNAKWQSVTQMRCDYCGKIIH